jgi:hypothetical protein
MLVEEIAFNFLYLLGFRCLIKTEDNKPNSNYNQNEQENINHTCLCRHIWPGLRF